MKKKKIIKIISTIALVSWSIALVLILSFGTKSASKIMSALQSFYNNNFNKYIIEDVEIINLKDSYLTNTLFDLEYKVISKNKKITN